MQCPCLKLQSTFLTLSGKYFEVSLFFVLPWLFGYQWHFLINVMTTIITSFIHSYNNIGVSDTYLIFPLFRGDYKLNLLFNGVFISFPDRSQDNYTINKNEHGRVFLLLAHNVNCFSVYVQSSAVASPLYLIRGWSCSCSLVHDNVIITNNYLQTRMNQLCQDERKNVFFCAEAQHKKLLSLKESKKIYCLNLLQALQKIRVDETNLHFPKSVQNQS